MRRVVVLAACVVVGGLLSPASALATEERGSPGHHGPDVRWIAEEVSFTLVLHDGTTIDEDSPEQEPPDVGVGSRLFIGETLYATEDGDHRGDEVGRTYVECTLQALPDVVLCDIAFVLDEGSQLHGSVLVGLDGGGSDEPAQFDIAVTGGTGEFAGADGVVSFLDTSDPDDPDAATTALYEAHLDR